MENRVESQDRVEILEKLLVLDTFPLQLQLPTNQDRKPTHTEGKMPRIVIVYRTAR
jgi:hypothetical protein